jgi:hypothetical protein
MAVIAELSGLTFLPLPSGRNVRGMTVGEGESELCRESLPGRGRRVKRFPKNDSRSHVVAPLNSGPLDLASWPSVHTNGKRRYTLAMAASFFFP